MRLRHWIKNFFGFSRSEANGFIFLLPIITLFIFSEPLWRWYTSRMQRDFSHERRILDSLSAQWKYDEYNLIPEDDEKTTRLFSFNPNQAAEDEFLSLGFSKSLAKRLVRYRISGGKFRIKSDLLKLYGMDSVFYSTLQPYILLPDKIELKEKSIVTVSERIKREPVSFDLNQADTTALKSVYGIGSKLSTRIIKFRESLGGFISSDQLYEIWGLDTLVIARLLKVSFIQDEFVPRTLNLNASNEEELAAHPYISKRMARAILTYRFQHGRLQSVDDLRTRLLMDEIQLNKIRPYVTVD